MRQPSRYVVTPTIVLFASYCALAPAAAETSPAPSERETVLGNVVDFAQAEPGPYQHGFLDFWRWSDEDRDRARTGSVVEVVADADLKQRVLRVRIDDAAIFAQGALPCLRLAPFFPPEADVLRLHVKVVRGTIRMFAGGPTAYFGNSDVYTRTEQRTAQAEPQWTTLDFNLHHPLRRNFRRSGLSTEATRNYYNRWAQEPLGVFVEAESAAEFLVERIELIAGGAGRPFPSFAPDDVRAVKPIADFEDGCTKNLFTLYMADGETEWFEQSWRREMPLRFTPTKLGIVDDARRGGKVLEAVGPFAEEVHCAGIRTTGLPEANAIRLDVRHDAPEYRNTLVGVGRAEALDLLVFVSPTGRQTDWQILAADAELRKQPGPGFDYQLSYRAIHDRQDVDFAIYHVRRYVRPREWTTLVLPAADFACIYGSGDYRERYLGNRPLTCDDVSAVAWLNPWCRVGRRNSNVTLRLDDVAFVRVPGVAAEHRSFWQLEAAGEVDWRDVPGSRGRDRIMLLPGDEW